jgi:two-component system chemotaxis sensor kinase CheA
MDDLLDEFIAETREMLAALGGELVAWESAPGERDRLDEIFRFVHTVKGNSGFFDVPRITALSHAAEDALAAVRAGKRHADHALVSAVLAAIDRIGELVQALETGEKSGSEDDGGLIDALTQSAPEPAAEAVSATTAPAAHRAAVRSIRLPVDLLDRMMSGVSDLVLARNELARKLRQVSGGTELDTCFERVSGSIADLRDAITRTRMQRIDALFSPLPRLVRDLCDETGKQVSLEIDGGDVELDREMIEMIRDPLTHIVRNAIDHGIEAAEERAAAGKAQAGKLSVVACQTGNQILIEIHDDGRGIDGDSLVDKALAAGTLSAERAKRLTTAQKTALIFEAGLSTAREVTAISGRGVGMDVVRANIERIGGVVDVESKAGQGVRLTLRVPLTLTIIPALTVGAGGQTFAIPRSAIEEIVRAEAGNVRIEALGGARVATIRDRRMPLVDFGTLIGVNAGEHGSMLIVLKLAGGGTFALGVDAVHDHEELVVKPAAPAVIAAGLYAGTTLADDGRPVLLLDPPGIAARAALSLERAEAESKAAVAAPAAPTVASLLFKSIPGPRRLVPVAAIDRIEEVAADAIGATGGRLHVAVDGILLPLEGCGSAPPERAIRILRLSDGATQIAYGVDEVIDIVAAGTEFFPAATPGEVRGVTLIGEDQAELLDLHWLFARHAAGGAVVSERPSCLLPAGDPFMENILRPLIESAGYRVLRAGEGEGAQADLVILSAEDAAPAPAGPGRVLRIRAAAEPLGKKDDSIHRYDRAGLLRALSAGGAKR